MLAHAFRPISGRFGRLIVTGVMLSTLVSGCDKMALTAPSGAGITLFPGATATLPLGGSMSIIASVIENGGSSSGTGGGTGGATSSAGTPVQNGTIVTFSTTLGQFESSQLTTVNGLVTANYTAGTTPGTASIFAFSGAAKSTELKITIADAAHSTIAIDVLSTTPTTGTPATVTFKVTPTVPTGVTVTRVTVKFGDGQSQDMGAISAATSISHLYTVGGPYAVSATLTDSTGASVTVSTTIVIAG